MLTVAPELPVENEISTQITKIEAGTSHIGTSFDTKLARYFPVPSSPVIPLNENANVSMMAAGSMFSIPFTHHSTYWLMLTLQTRK